MAVLVAYNDSPQGEAALRAAAGEATRRRLPLAVFVLTPQDDETAVPADLAHLLETLPSEVGPPAITYRDPDADPPEAILDEAERTSAELIVIGSRKRTPVGKFLLGSTTQRVLLDASVPVLVIKAQH
ncbi:universal stress protein [Oerskovia flava]|uniref:universal stress protein n=1 Tax=Oerskovia flava TaxID=2986422 RepID=UPI00223FD963|nr:universal stress protein [Oerskovia sp. JB1-3-2]